MTLFRPCIDLHHGKVKQIVGSSLTETTAKENFTSPHGSEWFAELYKKDGLIGGHVILLGAGNEEAALRALKAYPEGLQIGGGLNPEVAQIYIDAGASKAIFTSWLIPEKKIEPTRLQELSQKLPAHRVVIDLSCKKIAEGKWVVAKNKWQTLTEIQLSTELFQYLSPYCSEFLIHAVDVEGKCEGIDTELVKKLAQWSSLPVTYAGGANQISDLALVQSLSQGKVDLTIGSALDLFGGKISYQDCVAFNQRLHP